MKSTGLANQQTNTPLFLGIGLGIVLLALAAIIGHVLSVRAKLRRAHQAGRTVSADISPDSTPLTTVLRNGKAGDPINIQMVATSGQIGAAFALAGWYRADEIDLITSVRISVDSILGRAYSTAPVSNLYLFGRKEDLAFERPGHSVRQRDHLRLWQTTQQGSDSQSIWIGSATRDVKVELSKTNHMPTHGIAPDIDDERSLVVSELAQTGYVVAETTRPGFGKETHGFNGGGDPYMTDGQVVVLTLANVPTPPLIEHVHSPLLARIAKSFAGVIRDRLPKAGRERAARERERLTSGTPS